MLREEMSSTGPSVRRTHPDTPPSPPETAAPGSSVAAGAGSAPVALVPAQRPLQAQG